MRRPEFWCGNERERRLENPVYCFTPYVPEQTFHRELVPDVAIMRPGENHNETYRPDRSCAAGNDRVRFGPAGHGALARAGQFPDSGQGRPRAWSRTHGPRRAWSPLRVGQRPWSSLRMVQGPRSSPSPINLRWIHVRHSIARANANGSGKNGRAHAARPVQPPMRRGRSAEPHLHRDPDQVRVILGAELLLEQRGGVGHRLVGNLQRIGDFDDLVAAAQ